MTEPYGRAKIVLNPAARHGEAAKLEAEVRALFDGVIDYELVRTEAPWHAEALARQAVREGFPLIIAAGGDGTYHEVASGILAEGGRAALGCLPLGSGNDYARTLGISTDLRTAARELVRGTTKRVDVGTCNGKYFTNSVGIGFDGRVTHRATELKETTELAGLRLYFTALMDLVMHDFHGYRVRLAIDDGPEVELPFLMMAVTNGFTYGGGFRITPQAVNGDGLFDYCIIDDLPRADAMWRIPLVVVGKHNWMKKVTTGRAVRLRLWADEELFAQLDGEPYKASEFDLIMLPRVLTAVIGDGRVA
jgi:diacylglycerol kinase (ATP)